MFNDYITIYRHSVINGNDLYEKAVLGGFYWSEKTKSKSENKGIDAYSEIVVTSNPEMAEGYGCEWSVKVNDIITRGKGDDISSLKDLKDAHKVYAVEVNVCGSEVDNIVVYAK